VGGFPIEFWPGEDTKLCLDLTEKLGSGIMYDPNLIVFHHRRGLFAQLKQVSRYGRHRGQFARIFPKTSRLPGYFIPSVFTLGLLFGPIIISLFSFLALPYFVAISAYLLLLLLESLRVVALEGSLYAAFLFAVGVFETHLTYGVSFIIGFAKKPKLRLRHVDPVTGAYIGG
jgi:hypothetical protein